MNSIENPYLMFAENTGDEICITLKITGNVKDTVYNIHKAMRDSIEIIEGATIGSIYLKGKGINEFKDKLRNIISNDIENSLIHFANEFRKELNDN